MFQRALPSDILWLVLLRALNIVLCMDSTAHNPFKAFYKKDFQFLHHKIKECYTIICTLNLFCSLCQNLRSIRIAFYLEYFYNQLRFLRFKIQNHCSALIKGGEGRKTYRIYKAASSLSSLTAPKHSQRSAGFALNETSLLLPEQTHCIRRTICSSPIHALLTKVNSVAQYYYYFFFFYILWLPASTSMPRQQGFPTNVSAKRSQSSIFCLTRSSAGSLV